MPGKPFNIGLVELYATEDGTLWGPRMRDLYSIVRLPSRATELLAAILRGRGFPAVATFNPLYNRHRGRFHRSDLEALARMDVVGISSITRTQPPSYELARTLRVLNPGIRIVFGGPHATAHPDEALEAGDVVVRREGDSTLPELLERFAENPEDPCLEDVQGISYRGRDGGPVHNPDRPFLTSEELSRLPFPDLPEPVRRGITHSVVVTSRGCPFRCDFCAVIAHFGSGYRFLDVETSVGLVEHTIRQTRKPIFFGDDNFHARPARTKAILNRVLEKGLAMPPWGAQVRVEAAWDDELLGLMKRAGCNRLYVGVESINEETLRAFHKQSTRAKNEEAIRRFNRAGFSVHGMFVLGSDQDTPDTVRETVRFAQHSMLATAQFFSLMPLPGTPLTKRYAEEGKVLSRSWHLYDAHHVVVRPARMSPVVLQRELDRAHLKFYSWSEAFRHLLFSRDRLYNALIRVSGNILTRKIHFRMRAYSRRLRRLDRWSQEVESRYQRLVRPLGIKVQALGKEISETAGPLRASVEEFAAWLRKSLERIPQEFSGYGQRYVRFKTEALRAILPREALTAGAPSGGA